MGRCRTAYSKLAAKLRSPAKMTVALLSELYWDQRNPGRRQRTNTRLNNFICTAIDPVRYVSLSHGIELRSCGMVPKLHTKNNSPVIQKNTKNMAHTGNLDQSDFSLPLAHITIIESIQTLSIRMNKQNAIVGRHSSNDSFAYPMTCDYFMRDNRTGT